MAFRALVAYTLACEVFPRLLPEVSSRALCRSRKTLKNAFLVITIRFDAAENELSEIETFMSVE